MTDASNIHNNVIKLQVKVTANDSQYKDDAGTRMGYTLSQEAIDLSNKISSTRIFMEDLINEYAGLDYLQKEFRLDVNHLSDYDKKLFLSHITMPSEYEEYCSRPSLMSAGIAEYKETMQRMLNKVSEELYSNYLHEMGCTHSDEYYYGSER